MRHAELVEDALTAGRVAVTVAGNALVNIVVVDLSIEEGFDAGFEAEFGVVDCTDSEAEGREGSRLPLPRGLMNLVRPTPRTYAAETGFLPMIVLVGHDRDRQ